MRYNFKLELIDYVEDLDLGILTT